jgi:hypothetical protein
MTSEIYDIRSDPDSAKALAEELAGAATVTGWRLSFLFATRIRRQAGPGRPKKAETDLLSRADFRGSPY